MPEYDGEVIINARLNATEFENNLNSLTNKLNEKKQQIEMLKAQYNSISNRASKSKEQLYLEQEITKNLQKREDILSRLYGKQQLKAQDMAKLNVDLTKVNELLNKLGNDLYKLKLNPTSTQSVKELQREITKAEKEAQGLQNQLIKLSTKQQAPPTKASDAKSPFTSLINGANTVGRAFKGALGALISPINAVISSITSLGERIFSLGRTILIFGLIRSGFRQFRDYIMGALSTNDMFVASLNRIKSNLMTAFYPIYQFILPAVNTLMNILVKASGYLANFFSILTGRTVQESQGGAKALFDQQQAMKNSASVNNSATKSIKNQSKAYDELGKGIKGTKKELASFDKLNVLHTDKNKVKSPKAPKTPKSDGFVFSLDTSISQDDLTWLDNFNKNLQAKLAPTIESFKVLGDAVKDKIGGFAKQAFQDFNSEYLSPISDYLLTNAIPRFNNITSDMIKGIDWENLNTSLKGFWSSLEPFSETIGDGLLAFYQNVLAPLAEWAIGQALPATFDALKGALDLLNPVAKISGDELGRVYDKFLKPAGQWSGKVLVDSLKSIGISLSNIGDTLTKNRWFIEGAADIILGIAVVTAGYKTVLWLTSDALKACVIGAVKWAIALATNPVTLMIIAIGSLIGILIYLTTHWNEVTAATQNFFNTVRNNVSGFVNEIKRIGDWFKWLGAQIGKVFSSFKLFNGESSFTPFKGRIPGFAQGAVLKGGDPMLAYLNDQPRGQVNIETPLNTMLDAFRQALSESQGPQNNNIVIQANGDISSIVDMLSFRIKKQDQIIGTNYIQDGIFA